MHETSTELQIYQGITTAGYDHRHDDSAISGGSNKGKEEGKRDLVKEMDRLNDIEEEREEAREEEDDDEMNDVANEEEEEEEEDDKKEEDVEGGYDAKEDTAEEEEMGVSEDMEMDLSDMDENND